ncbi:hypothetical protein DFH06DRAFT_1165938 [Mycena polygramma]|nr:hypothetical protein DFH06DRAFT_1165938 [Mycena polygramma]
MRLDAWEVRAARDGEGLGLSRDFHGQVTLRAVWMLSYLHFESCRLPVVWKLQRLSRRPCGRDAEEAMWTVSALPADVDDALAAGACVPVLCVAVTCGCGGARQRRTKVTVRIVGCGDGAGWGARAGVAQDLCACAAELCVGEQKVGQLIRKSGLAGPRCV